MNRRTRKLLTRWVLEIEEIEPGRFDYTRLYDRKGIPNEQWDEANDYIGKVSKKTIIKLDIRDVLEHPICQLEEGELPPSLAYCVWNEDEKKWEVKSYIQWVTAKQVLAPKTDGAPEQ